jgi:glycosyltransferase involved in cell wall biosynthesis
MRPDRGSVTTTQFPPKSGAANRIGLLSKNNRAKPLYRAITGMAPQFVDVGVARIHATTKLAALTSSAQWDWKRMRLDAQFSPVQCQSLQRACEKLLSEEPGVSAVLYWGATNQPTSRLPYFVISDGPFDPEDSTYPAEWVPRRWAQNYWSRQRNVYREAAHVFTLSQWAAEKIKKVHGLTDHDVTSVGWGPLQSCDGMSTPAGEEYFVSIGSGWELKGMDVLAEAGELLHAAQARCSILLAGDPRGFHVRPRPGVKLMPHTVPGAQAQELIAKARGLLIGSWFDASPHVIMEAFQAGTPVIATRVCGIPEVVSAEMGYLVDPGDSGGFARAMQSCLDQDPKAQRSRVYESYQAKFGGWERTARRIVSKIDEVLSSRKIDSTPRRIQVQ